MEIYGAQKFDTKQNGYTFNHVTKEPISGWNTNWFLFADEGADPVIIDLSTSPHSVLRAFHGMGEWEFGIEANTIGQGTITLIGARYLTTIESVEHVTSAERKKPSPLKIAFALRKIVNHHAGCGNLMKGGWPYDTRIQRTDREGCGWILRGYCSKPSWMPHPGQILRHFDGARSRGDRPMS